ncbi:hypothetical protein LT679_16415 [Mucilaginibacter roseus]|uniref:Uncharacterized protein n=1 Tax=Mucilaginibacter roseus TaxID=1528868 RepID=A0ABS8U762_9SPHI|nr:hypothetical protein [Mucilaginibacter roseus]MCD8742197.1 hypothetical protein [Mucilaginibacter roseus]
MRFDNGGEALYAPDAKSTLKGRSAIMNNPRGSAALETRDFKDIYKIGHLLYFGR